MNFPVTHIDEKIQAKREQLTRFWSSKEGIGRPLLQIRFENYDNALKPRQLFFDHELDLRDQIRRNDEVLQNPNDFVPRLFPYLGTAAFASAFGAEVVYPNEDQPACQPVIFKAEDVYKLSKPALDSGYLKHILEKTEYFLERTKGQYPISISDFQGPFDTACLLWDKTDFLMALYEHPAEVHYLMEIVTDNLIEFGLKMKEMIPDFVPAHTPNLWLPADMGITVSEDSIVMIGPEQFKDFVLPYLEKISSAFGGLILHSCGDWKHHLAGVKKIKGLKGINFGAGEIKMKEVASVYDSDDCEVKIIPHIGLNHPYFYPSNTAFIKEALLGFKHRERLFLLCWENDYNPFTSWKTESFAEIQEFLIGEGIDFNN